MRSKDTFNTYEDRDIDCSDIPETDEGFWSGAKIGNPEKKGIFIRLDQDVIDFFKAGQGSYQNKINAVLRHYVEAQR